MSEHRDRAVVAFASRPLVWLIATAMMIGPAARADESATGPVTWVEPDPTTRTLTLRGSFEGAALAVTDPETGESLNTPAKLYEHGWVVTPDGFLRSRVDGFYETIPLFDEMGQPLRIEIRGLHPGAQQTAVQYFSQPFAHGSTWSYRGYATVAGVKDKAVLAADRGRVVRGTGGHDQSTLYDRVVGTVGGEDDPARSVAVTIGKNKWSKQLSIRGLRVVTAPSMTATLTTMDRPEQRRVRAALQPMGPAGANGERAYHVAALPSAVKVKPKSFAGLDPSMLSDRADLAEARHAHASFQILLYHPDKTLKNVSWSVEGLNAPEGGDGGALETTVAPVGYVRQPQSPHQVASYGYLPDPILTFMESVTVKPGDAQTLWVRVKIPADAASGVYRGAVVVEPEGMPAHRVPVELKVWDVVLPEMPHLPVVTGVGKQSDFEMGYGINPASIYAGNNVFAKPASEAMPVLKRWAERGVTAVNLRYFTYRDQPPPPADELNALVGDIERRYELAKRAGLGEEAYVYMFDEAKPSDYQTMAVVAGAIKDRMPDLKLMTTAYWGRDESFGREAGVPIDIWVPIVQHFRKPDLAEIGRAKGREIWWYTANYPRSPMPNVLHDNAAMETRMLMGLMPHAFGVEGYLYYATTRWRGRKPITDGPYTDWKIQRGYGHGGWYQKTRNNQPLPSVRLENFKDGLEDYDLIAIALEHKQALVEAGESIDSPVSDTLSELTDVPNPYVQSVLDYTRDPAELEALRRDLADYIHQADRRLNR